MKIREKSLIDQIEQDALDDDVPLARTLRKVVALGGKSGSSDLRDWASRELQGYVGLDPLEIPDYRKVPAAIMIDGSTINAIIRGQQISRFDLPAEVREHVQERVDFNHGVGELEAMLRRAREDGVARLGILGGAELAKMMTYKMGQAGFEFQNVERVYHAVGEPNLAGVIDAIRTTLVTLVAEMRAGMPETAETPSAAVADQAVQVVVYGAQNRVQVGQASGSRAHAVHSGDVTRSRTGLLAVLGTLATIAGVFVAVAAWQGWGM